MVARRSILLVVLILSSVGYSLGLLIVRVFGDLNGLTNLLNMQSNAVFISFLLQMGFRSSSRALIYSNKKNVTHIFHLMLEKFLFLISLLGLLFYYSNETYYISYGALLALITTRLSVAIVYNIKVYFYSIAVFLISIFPSFLILIETPSIYVELISTILILLFMLFPFKYIRWKKSFFKVIYSVFIKSMSYLLGGALSAISVYYLTQYILELHEENNELDISYFADFQILTGVFVLFIGKALLLFEKRLYRNSLDRIYLYLLLNFLNIIVTVLVVLASAYIYDASALAVSSVVFLLLSRVTLGYPIQYVTDGRKSLDVLLVVLFSLYVFLLQSSIWIDLLCQVLIVASFMTIAVYPLCKSIQTKEKSSI